MFLSRPLQGNPLKICHLIKPRMSFPGSCDDSRHPVMACSCTQTRGHQCFRVDSDADARFKIKFLTLRARACQLLHGKHLPPAGKATPAGEPWLSRRSAHITCLPCAFDLESVIPSPWVSGPLSACHVHVTSLERVVGSVLSDIVGSAWLPVGTRPVVTCIPTIPCKAGPRVKVFKPHLDSGDKGTDISHPMQSLGLPCAPEVSIAGGDGILNVFVYFPPGLSPAPLLVFTFLRGRTQGKANAQKWGSC